MEKSAVRLELRIDWSEQDLFGHVNNVAYFKYIQASRVRYWDQIGLTHLYRETGFGPMLVSTSCQFRQQLFYPGNIVVAASVYSIGTTSMVIRHRILDEQGGLAAEAEDVVVCFDFRAGTKAPVPAYIRERIEDLEGRRF